MFKMFHCIKMDYKTFLLDWTIEELQDIWCIILNIFQELQKDQN